MCWKLVFNNIQKILGAPFLQIPTHTPQAPPTLEFGTPIYLCITDLHEEISLKIYLNMVKN